jgi:uncharacterized protein (DUF58 family)
MQPTRRAVAVLAVGAVLAGLGVVLQSPVYLYGAVGVGAWVVAEAVAFTRRVETVVSADATQRLAESRTRSGRPVEVSVVLRDDDPIRGVTGIELSPPLAATHVDGTERLDVDKANDGRNASDATGGSDSYRLAGVYEFDVTGRFEFDQPVVDVESQHGLFTERAPVGDPVTCTVEPSTPSDVAVGQGGTRISLGIGEHDAQIVGSGFTPGDLRKYAAGDPQSLIDWKTTARQGEPYVREYEAAGELETLLFVDHRGTTDVGPEGRQALDYLRSIALWVVDYANARDDPLGLYGIGDDGPTARVDPSSGTGQYRQLTTRIHDLTPTGRGSGWGPRLPARPDASTLVGDGAFERVLSTFVDGHRQYVERVTDDPLFDVVRTTLARTGSDPWIVVLTTDANPTELAETVRAASKNAAHVTAFVAPTVLYEPGSLADLDAAYDRYEDFEQFRSRLVGDGVDVFEVAPGERLDAVLASARDTREVGR